MVFGSGSFNISTQEKSARKKKVYVCTSRLAIEKNLDAFLSLKLDGEKWMIGSGPEEKDSEKNTQTSNSLK